MGVSGVMGVGDGGGAHSSNVSMSVSDGGIAASTHGELSRDDDGDIVTTTHRSSLLSRLP